MTGTRDGLDGWAAALFGLHLGQALVFALCHPWLRYGTDLLAYFVYFRSWWSGDASLQALDFFVVPKPLLVFTLGALGDVSAAFACSAVASAALGTVVYLLGRAAFGRAVGVLLSLLLLLDAEKTMLTVRSHADLYLALFLFAAIHFALRRQLALASVSLLLSALLKPVTLPCALVFLLLDDGGRRPWRWAVLPLAAIPLVLLSNQALLGSPTGPARFLASFDDLHRGTAIGAAGVLPFVAWTQLVQSVFVTTAPWGIVGLGLWLVRDRARLASPLFLVPLLFLGGWVALAAVAPFAPFFRFFWPVQVWFLGFILFGMSEAARLAARARPALAIGLQCALLAFAVRDQVTQQRRYLERFARPHERTTAFVAGAAETLAHERREGEAVHAPIAFVPYLLWRVGMPPGEVVVGAARRAQRPEWLFYVTDPAAASGERPGDTMLGRLTREAGYVVRFSDGASALLALPAPDRPAATDGAQLRLEPRRTPVHICSSPVSRRRSATQS